MNTPKKIKRLELGVIVFALLTIGLSVYGLLSREPIAFFSAVVALVGWLSLLEKRRKYTEA